MAKNVILKNISDKIQKICGKKFYYQKILVLKKPLKKPENKNLHFVIFSKFPFFVAFLSWLSPSPFNSVQENE